MGKDRNREPCPVTAAGPFRFRTGFPVRAGFAPGLLDWSVRPPWSASGFERNAGGWSASSGIEARAGLSGRGIRRRVEWGRGLDSLDSWNRWRMAGRARVKDWLIVGGILAAWVFVSGWLLPRLGVPT